MNGVFKSKQTWVPGRPCNPISPLCPLAPFSPISPLSPLTPSGPGAPGLPLGPWKQIQLLWNKSIKYMVVITI